MKPLGEHLDAQQAAWLAGHLLARSVEADVSLLVDFLAGCSARGHIFSADFYGCLQSHRQVRDRSESEAASRPASMHVKAEVSLLTLWLAAVRVVTVRALAVHAACTARQLQLLLWCWSLPERMPAGEDSQRADSSLVLSAAVSSDSRCMRVQVIPLERLSGAIVESQTPTAQRLAAAEEEVRCAQPDILPLPLLCLCIHSCACICACSNHSAWLLPRRRPTVPSLSADMCHVVLLTGFSVMLTSCDLRAARVVYACVVGRLRRCKATGSPRSVCAAGSWQPS